MVIPSDNEEKSLLTLQFSYQALHQSFSAQAAVLLPPTLSPWKNIGSLKQEKI